VTPRGLALAQARGRIALGAALVLAPGLAGRLWIGEDARQRAVKVFTRALDGPAGHGQAPEAALTGHAPVA
jgi:hypothetical protein